MRGYTNILISPANASLLAAKPLAFVDVPIGMPPQTKDFSLSELTFSVRKRILV